MYQLGNCCTVRSRQRHDNVIVKLLEDFTVKSEEEARLLFFFHNESSGVPVDSLLDVVTRRVDRDVATAVDIPT